MKIGIVGLGVIGGSFAEALQTAGYHDIYLIVTKNAWYRSWNGLD